MKERRHIYGRHPVSEALRSHPSDIKRIFLAGAERSSRFSDLRAAAEHHGITVTLAEKSVLDRLVGRAPHQGIVAEIVPFAYVDLPALLAIAKRLSTPPLLLALDQVQDPHNLGSLVRSAFALGCHGLMIPKDRACDVTPAVVKASAGATAHLPIAVVTNLRRSLEDAKDAGLWVVGASAASGVAVHSFDFLQPSVIVIGSEGKGLRHGTQAGCDHLVHIPMAGDLGSLNAAVAGAICLYEASSQRSRGRR